MVCIYIYIYIHIQEDRIVKLKESLRLQELITPKSKDSQVLIKVKSADVFHSDIFIFG